MLDPAQLKVLQEIARTGSFSAAARALGYTQPAISYQVRRLEKSVGTPLAVRVGQKMMLTPAGEALLVHADRILAAIRVAEQDLALLVGGSAGVVRLAAFPSLCATVVPTAMAELNRRVPPVKVALVQAEPPQARDLVRRGDVELAVTYHLAEEPRRVSGEPRLPNTPLKAEPITTDEVSLILPAAHPAAGKRLINIGELARDTWIIAGTRFERRLHQMATEAGFHPQTMTVADDYVVMQALVANGLGVTLVPDLALTAHRDERTVQRTLRHWPARHIEVEYWPDMHRVPAVADVITALRAAARA